MKKVNLLALSLIVILNSGCIAKKSKLDVSFKKQHVTSSVTNASVSSIQIINNQLVITGASLQDVSNVKVDGSAFNELFSIESKTATKIIANSIRAFSFDVSKVFNVILSDANASVTFPIDFSLCKAVLNGKSFDCEAPVADKDVLSYDATSGKWKPRAITGLNYIGAFNASSNPATGPALASAGSYYIISHDGVIASTPFAIGDWLVSNGSSWQKIENWSGVKSVFGRNGVVSPQAGDYNLSMLGDIDFGVAPVAGKILKFNGTKWVASDDLSGGGAGSVTAAEIADGAVIDAKIDTIAASKITGTITSTQIADGTIVNADIDAAAAIDYSKINVPAAAIDYAKLNIGAGEIAADRISGLPILSSILAASIADNDTTHAPSGEAVYEALLTKLGTGGGTLSVGTISGVPTPVNPSDVVNKDYVDDEDALRLLKAGDTMTGALTLDSDLKIKGGSNYVTIKGSATTANYNLILPDNDGDANQVLKTDGSGVLSWVDDNAGAGAFSGAGDRAVITTAGGALDVSATTSTELGYVSGVTSSIQTQLTNKQATDATLTALAGYNSNGILVQTAPDTFIGRTLVGTSNRLTVTNADGFSGNPTLNIPTALLPSPIGGDVGKILMATGADTSVWTALGLSDVTTALGFTPINKTGETLTTGIFTLSGTAVLRTLNPIAGTDVANKQYVDGFGQWAKSGSNISYSGGNVGIGIASPGAALEVAGQVKITGGVPGNGKVLTSNASGLASWQNISGDNLGNHTATQNINLGSSKLVGAGGTNGISIDSSGNVDFGTSVGVKIGPNSTVGSSWGSLAGGFSSTASSISTFAFGTNVTASNWYAFASGEGTTAAGRSSVAMGEDITVNGSNSIGFGLAQNASPPVVTNANTMAIMGGKVGIGTTAPVARLEVVGGVTKLEQAPWNVPTLLNSWVHYGASYANASYRLDSMGYLRLRGMIKNGSLGSGYPVFTLPVGFRPIYNVEVISAASGGSANIIITPAGSVYVETTSGTSWVSLDNISIPLD